MWNAVIWWSLLKPVNHWHTGLWANACLRNCTPHVQVYTCLPLPIFHLMGKSHEEGSGSCFTPKSKRTKTSNFLIKETKSSFRTIRLHCIIFVTVKYIFTFQNPYILTSTSFRKSLENTYLQNKLFFLFISQTCSWQVLWRRPKMQTCSALIYTGERNI